MKAKRKPSELILQIYGIIQKEKEISMSKLERKVRTAPQSLYDYLYAFEQIKIIKKRKKGKTTIIKINDQYL